MSECTLPHEHVDRDCCGQSMYHCSGEHTDGKDYLHCHSCMRNVEVAEWRTLTPLEALEVSVVCVVCGANLQPLATMGVDYVHDCETGEVAPA